RSSTNPSINKYPTNSSKTAIDHQPIHQLTNIQQTSKQHISQNNQLQNSFPLLLSSNFMQGPTFF
ncbi:hypothetical protein LINPERHAP1_LOCUS16721, partial [Linum perenne]